MKTFVTRSVRFVLASALVIGAVNADAAQRGIHGDSNNRCAMIPPNNQRVPESFNTGITEVQFNKILDAVEKVYTPIIAEKGGKLAINRRWTDNTVNAYAQRMGNTWSITMFGGLARHKEATMDGFAMVACHELGHHVGGAPKYNGNDWASVEGQSDYFATLKCMRKVLAQFDNWEAIHKIYAPGDIDPLVTERCKLGQGKDKQQFATCVRSAMGGLALARLLADLSRDKMPEFKTPDLSKTSTTQQGHPEAQCRLDTYFGGAVCPVGMEEDVSDTDMAAGVCTPTKPGMRQDRRTEMANTLGLRPACWFQGNGKYLFPRQLMASAQK